MALPTPLMLDPAMLADSSLVHPEDDDDSEYEYEYHPTETEVRPHLGSLATHAALVVMLTSPHLTITRLSI